MWNLKISTREIPNSKAWPEKGELVKKKQIQKFSSKEHGSNNMLQQETLEGRIKILEDLLQVYFNGAQKPKVGPYKSNFKL